MSPTIVLGSGDPGSRLQAPLPPIRHAGISTTSLKPKLFHRQDRILTLMLKYSKYTDHEIFLKLLMLLGKNNSVFSEFKSVPPIPPRQNSQIRPTYVLLCECNVCM